jgi:hypothetical protein
MLLLNSIKDTTMSKRITLSDFIAIEDSNAPPLLKADGTPLIEEVIPSHITESKNIYIKISGIYENLKKYFKLFDNFNIYYQRRINDDYSVVNIKYFGTKKKIIIVFTNDKITCTFYNKTSNIIEDISNLYLPDKVIEGSYHEVKNQLYDIMLWGFGPSATVRNARQRTLGVAIHSQLGIPRKDVLYFGTIVKYEIEEAKADTVVFQVEFLEDPGTQYSLEILNYHSFKMATGMIYIRNYKGDSNIMNIGGAGSILDFASQDFQNIRRYLIDHKGVDFNGNKEKHRTSTY